MPIYQYRCSNCGHIKEEFKTIEHRNDPLSKKCDECHTFGGIKMVISGGGIADPMRLGRIKPPSEFTGILKRIASENPGHNMNIRD